MTMAKTYEDFFTVQSSSMRPALKIGDKISTIPINLENIAVGDVVVFAASNQKKFIVHRVVEKEGFVLVTAGDNLRSFDSPISFYDVLGLVKETPRKRPKSRFFRNLRAIKRKIFRILGMIKGLVLRYIRPRS